jgi:hypothetical protein
LESLCCAGFGIVAGVFEVLGERGGMLVDFYVGNMVNEVERMDRTWEDRGGM